MAKTKAVQDSDHKRKAASENKSSDQKKAASSGGKKGSVDKTADKKADFENPKDDPA